MLGVGRIGHWRWCVALGIAVLMGASGQALAKDSGRDRGGARAGRDADARGHRSMDSRSARGQDFNPHRTRRGGSDRGHSDRGDSARGVTCRSDDFGWYGASRRGLACSSGVGFSVGIDVSSAPGYRFNSYGQPCGWSSYAVYRGGRADPLRSYYGSEPWYRGPSTVYRLVEVDPDQAATRVRAGAAQGAESGYHQWQAQVRAEREMASASASRPGAPSVSRSPTALQKGHAPEQVKPDAVKPEHLSDEEARRAWSALEEGRLQEAHALMARGADTPAITGQPDQRAAFSAGYAVASVLLGREEAAAWALRRAGDLDDRYAERVPWSDALRARVREALRRASESHASQPTPDRALLVRALGRLAE